MIRFVRGNYLRQRRLQILSKSWPGQRQIIHQAMLAEAFGALRCGRNALNKTTSAQADDCGVQRVVSMIVAVFAAVRRQQVVQPEFSTDHRCQAATGHPDAVFMADVTQVNACQPRQISSVSEMPIEKVSSVQETLYGVLRKKQRLAPGQSRRTIFDLRPVIAGGRMTKGFEGRSISFGPVGRSRAKDLVADPIVQRS